MTNPNVLLVFPRFNPNSFWSLQAACDLFGARCPAPPLGLITLAALLPRHWNIRLVNRNAEDLGPDDLDWADMVMTGGMLPQRFDSLHLIEICQARGKRVVIGGPDAMSSPEVYEQADFLVIGEAEGIIGQFIEAWEAGVRHGRFRGERFKVDVATSPIPRWDLIDFSHYLFVGVQFSRGCPFNCEFCDIIELFGRVPRSKTSAQMIAEIQALHDAGYRGHVDFVDDNLIGNKKALKQFLPVLEAWQRRNGYPLTFSTEASINMADDDELLGMLARANFVTVFIGIESPDTETLIATRKKQNTRRSLADSVARIHAAGMTVSGGFIIGFDTEKDRVAEGMIDCIEDTGIPMCMVGLLTALPSTQLTRRLEKAGRMLPIAAADLGDQCTAGLNFTTLRPRRDILLDYKTVLESVYRPAAFFRRIRTMGLRLRRPGHRVTARPLITLRDLRGLLRLMWQMTFHQSGAARHFWGALADIVRHNPAAFDLVVIQMMFYLHLGPFAELVVRDIDRQIAALDDEEQLQPIARHPLRA
jgi:radical SAM superfamily enzyme YgiQ (UPF0313 family)